MNCDTVFDVLTRGPFPTGSRQDAAVEAHLARCPGCHRLAEALRPALELFQEAIPAEETRDLPGYWGELGDAPCSTLRAPVQLTELPGALRRKFSPARQWFARRAAPEMWRWSAATLVVSGVVMLMWAGRLGDTAPEQPSGSYYHLSQQPPGDAAVQSPLTRNQLVLQLASVCFAPGAPQVPPSEPLPEDPSPGVPALESNREADAANLTCCTHCHNSRSRLKTPQATTLVAQSCLACHN